MKRKSGIVLGIIGLVIVGIFGIGSIIFCFYSTWRVRHSPPEPYIFELPEFKGEILARSEINPGGGFTINRDFESISQWPENSILTYSVTVSEPFYVLIQAWRLDTVVQYNTEKRFPFSFGDGLQKKFFYPGQIVRKGNILEINPAFYSGDYYFINFLSFCFFLIMIYLVFDFIIGNFKKLP